MKALFFLVLAACAFAVEGETVDVTVDFGTVAGTMKPLHGVNNSPVRLNGTVWAFERAGIPFMRPHDACGAWGGAHFVDVPNVFPNFEADENDPKSYDFAFTDAYLKGVVSAGTKIFYRLGVTIENNWRIKAYNIRPPKDFAKWARICEHIVRHYNEGWADGFKWNIEYWEIWGEPENPPLWQGTKEQYFELYRIAANHLKTCFPSLKVGGYGSSGLYAVDDPSADSFRKSFVTFFEDFCRYVTDPKTKAPLDFFSWHMYVAQPDDVGRIATHAAYVRRTLDKAGLTATENIFDEWNYVGPDWYSYDDMKTMVGAACVGEAFCLMQASSIDKAMYYDAYPQRAYCGLFTFPMEKTTHTFDAFLLWNGLYRLGTAVKTAVAGRPPYPTSNVSSYVKRFGVAAAKGAKGRAVFLVNNDRKVTRQVKLTFPAGGGEGLELVRLDAENRVTDGIRAKKGIGRPFDPSAEIVLPPLSIAVLRTPSAHCGGAGRASLPDCGGGDSAQKVRFAGQDDDASGGSW